MLKKIKVNDIINYDNYSDIRFFEQLKSDLESYLNNTIGLSQTDYHNSSLYGLLDNYGRELDGDYFVENSSEKWLSRYAQLIYKKLIIDSEETIDYFGHAIAKHVVVKFGLKWWKISQAITTDYRPLENYDMEEIRTPNLTESLTRKQNTDTNVNQTTESGIYGFNSTESQPTATGEGDTHTTGLKANNEIADTKTNTGTESLTRHGNIGVTTSQQMLESEIKLRQYNFIEEVFKDIDSILCLKIY